MFLKNRWARLVGCVVVLVLSSTPVFAEGWQAGFSRVVITPDEPLWMAGYAGRTAPAEGKVHDLYARVAAFRDPNGMRIAMVSTDLIGVPAEMASFISGEVEKKHGLPRRGLMLTCSHTHCGPALADRLKHIYFLSEEENQKVMRYQEVLNQKILEAIDRAIENLEPAELFATNGRAEFASYRRQPMAKGPYDHDVPVLKVTSPGGKTIRGVVFGYACHNTTMSFQKFCGDYAGFAALNIEANHPETVACFFTGCGADQNPLPRRKIEIAERYGRMLSDGVEEAMEGDTTPVTGTISATFSQVTLPLEHTPSRAELEDWTKNPDKYRKSLGMKLLEQLDSGKEVVSEYPYPVQVWKFGKDFTWVALGGEITVEYSLRLKKELGPGLVWVTGYANDVMAYIPSERVLREGGYEGESSMVYYMMPSKWASGIEERIVGTVHELFSAASR